MYFKIELSSIKQSNAVNVYNGKIKFRDLEKCARITARKEDSESFQREVNKLRTKKISEYIRKCVEDENFYLSIFPTPLVLAIETEIQKEFSNEEEILSYFDDNELAKPVLLKEDDKIIAYIPKIEKSIFIVDGQHRFMGLKDFSKNLLHQEVVDSFEFFITLLVDYDIYEQSKVFADINFTQKPVNKSLYYDIFGSIPDERNEITFAHYIVKRFNNDESFTGIVKMLGSGSGIVSQAFLVETIIQNMLSIKSNFYDIYKDYVEDDGENYKTVLNVFIDYFKYIKENFEDFIPKLVEGEYKSSKYEYTLFKTTGMFALIKLLNRLYSDIEIENYNKDEFYKILDVRFSEIIEQKNDIFGYKKDKSENEFLNTAGKGIQNKLYNKLEKLLVF